MTLLSHINSMPIGFVILPLAHVLLPLLVFPQPISFHRPVFEIPHIVFLVEGEQSMSMRFIIHKIANIGGLVGKHHISLPHFMVETEIALIERILCDHHSQSMLCIVIDPSKIQVLLTRNDLIGLLLGQLCRGKEVLAELVALRIDLLQLEHAALLAVLFWVVGADAECVLEWAIHNFIQQFI